MANNFPNLRPTFSADFVNGIYVDPRITFTRAGTRTYFGQEMVKAEENLLLQSQTFNNASWIKAKANTATNPVVTANYDVAPDGTTTAERVQFAASGATSADVSTIYQIISPVSGDGTVSIWVKSNSGAVTLRLQTTSSGSIAISVTTDWTRFTRTTASADRLYLFLRGDDATSADVSVWGAQLEQRSFATAYTATTTQPITRYQRQLETAAANEWPREFDPVTGECLGRSVWESRTNLLQRSEEFDNAYWTKTSATISANQTIAPDGALTADIIEADVDGIPGHVNRSFAFAGASSYTVSYFVKRTGDSAITAALTVSGRVAVEFNLSTLVSTTTAELSGWAVTSKGIIDVGNGWFRVTMTFLTSSSHTAETRFGEIRELNGTRTLFIWGAQLEAGAFATPYIPTVAAQVTRVADSAVMTGVNFSSWFNPSEGTLFVESQSATGATQNRAVYITDGTTSNYIGNVVNSTASSSGQVVRGGSVQAGFTSDATSGVFYKQALSYKTNDFAFCGNGGAVSTDDSGIIPIVNRVLIGGLLEGGPAGSGYIKRITYYNQALTSANLQAVTR
jgi:hypothetical protein